MSGYKGLVKFLPDFSRQEYIPNQSVVPNFTSAIRNNLNNIIIKLCTGTIQRGCLKLF